VPDVCGSRRVTVELSGPVIGAAIGLAGVLLGLAVSGDRTERQRRRDLHGRALGAVLAYGEMPFMIRRRRSEEKERSSERVRLSDHFSEVKAEMSTCEVLLAADGDERVSAAYRGLVLTARATAGAEAHEAWENPPIAHDSDMNMGALHVRLAPFRAGLREFELELASATLPRRMRMWRWWRGTDITARGRREVRLVHDRPAADQAELDPGGETSFQDTAIPDQPGGHEDSSHPAR
jgi:hypothetical protein